MGQHNAECQCGQLKLQASKDPDFVIACNCRACQKRTGAPFGTGGYFRKDTLTITGNTSSWKRTADSGRELENFFCPDCGSTLYWTLEMRPDYMGVAFGMFDEPLPDPVRAIWTEAQHDWVSFPEDWPHFPHGTPEP